MLPRRFRGRFREDFPPFFIVLRSFFVILWSCVVLEGSSIVFYMDVANVDVNNFYTCYKLMVQGSLPFVVLIIHFNC